MSLEISCLLGISFLCEIVSAGVLAYAIATSKADSKKIIKTVLIGTVAYAIVTIKIQVIGVVIPFVLFPIIFGTLGSQTGKKFNTVGFISLIAYLISLFVLPMISNKYEDSISYQILDGLVEELGGKLTPTQFDILNFSYNLSDGSTCFLFIMFCGAILFAILYFDYRIFNSKSFVGKLAGYGLSKVGVSLSVFSVVVIVLAALPAITAYLRNKKENT